MKDHLLALDFDGVIWDSVGETYHIALRTWKLLHGQEPAVDEGAWRRGRWLVRTGGEFGLITALIAEGHELEDFPKDEFLRIAEERRAELRRFGTEFYRQRTLARQEDLEGWLAWQQPYPGIVEELPGLREDFREVVICTTKDEGSTRELLQTRGLDLPILGREFSLDKREQMRRLVETRGVEPGRILFVDDLLHNLEPVASLGVRVALAEWGYNTAAEREAARSAGVPLVRLAHFAEDLRRVLEG